MGVIHSSSDSSILLFPAPYSLDFLDRLRAVAIP
jgi:hypothetical protein